MGAVWSNLKGYDYVISQFHERFVYNIKMHAYILLLVTFFFLLGCRFFKLTTIQQG